MGHPVLAGDGDRMGGWEGVMSLGYLPSAPILQRWRVTLPVTGTHDLDRVRSPNPGRSLATEGSRVLAQWFPFNFGTASVPSFGAYRLHAASGKRALLR